MFDSSKSVSRRQFLKMAGLAGAALGAGAGLGGLVAACGDSSTTTTAAGPATTVGATGTTAGAATTVSAAAEGGRTIKLGFISPMTGTLAVFSIADEWMLAHTRNALKGGIVTGDGKRRDVEIIVKDSQSDSNRASQVAGDLILQDKVDMLTACGGPDTDNPASEQGEALGCPTLNNFSPWQSMFLDENGKPLEKKWVFGNLFGSELTITAFTDAFEKSGVQTNKKIGMLFANDADAKGWMDPSAAPRILAEKGYALIGPEYYQPPAEDFTSQITRFKNEGCEIICGTNDPPFFSNFWTQSLQQGFRPKFCSSGKCLMFPQVLESLPNNIGLGLIGEISWHPTWKIKDTLSDLDSAGLAADYEAKTGQQWTASIGRYAVLEWAIDVYKRATNPEDKESVVEAIKKTKNAFQQGAMDFTAPVDQNSMHPHPNNCKAWIGAGQWRNGTTYPFEVVVVSNAASPGTEVQDKAQALAYS
ncbi:MAG: ABC transporter substrate-binding protein [Armatimonadetes bacterium]|nr:ABC transporter substrate-binding protein [Armatimonadota bacterium]